MADNVEISAGSGTVIRTDDDGSAQYQCVKLVWGADGTFNFTDAASGKAIPVTLYDSTGTELTNSAAAEDAIFSNGGTCVVAGAVRRDDIGSNVSTDGDIDIPATNGYGVLRVGSPAEHTVTIAASQTGANADVEVLTGGVGDY